MSASTCPFTKNYPLCMDYHPYHFVGEVLLHSVYITYIVNFMVFCDITERENKIKIHRSMKDKGIPITSHKGPRGSGCMGPHITATALG